MPIIQSTADGSHTLFLPEMDEHYHSVNGAIQESKHVYIDAGLNQCPKETVHVLELGFGTGLNAFLTALEAAKSNRKVFYTTIEKFPLPDEIIDKLNYSDWDAALFQSLHRAEWETPVAIRPSFSLHKIQADFLSVDFPEFYDVVYYDAFAPDKQPEVWSQELFDKIYAKMNPNGIMTTYCAKGEIRRRMQKSGFSIERISGPPGKREMLRALKTVSLVHCQE
jgi:tRNA U34 5-methylaminomethyl-2-thiouridine-forming methyltransferase MnmC